VLPKETRALLVLHTTTTRQTKEKKKEEKKKKKRDSKQCKRICVYKYSLDSPASRVRLFKINNKTGVRAGTGEERHRGDIDGRPERESKKQHDDDENQNKNQNKKKHQHNLR